MVCVRFAGCPMLYLKSHANNFCLHEYWCKSCFFCWWMIDFTKVQSPLGISTTLHLPIAAEARDPCSCSMYHAAVVCVPAGRVLPPCNTLPCFWPHWHFWKAALWIHWSVLRARGSTLPFFQFFFCSPQPNSKMHRNIREFETWFVSSMRLLGIRDGWSEIYFMYMY